MMLLSTRRMVDSLWTMNADVIGVQKNETSIIREGDPRTERLNMMLMESSDSTNWQAAINVASESDVIIAALGENPTLCGEARQRKRYLFAGRSGTVFKKN